MILNLEVLSNNLAIIKIKKPVSNKTYEKTEFKPNKTITNSRVNSIDKRIFAKSILSNYNKVSIKKSTNSVDSKILKEHKNKSYSLTKTQSTRKNEVIILCCKNKPDDLDRCLK